MKKYMFIFACAWLMAGCASDRSDRGGFYDTTGAMTTSPNSLGTSSDNGPFKNNTSAAASNNSSTGSSSSDSSSSTTPSSPNPPR